MKWRGVEISELPDATLLEALDAALKISGELWAEVARRGIMAKAVNPRMNPSSSRSLDDRRRR